MHKQALVQDLADLRKRLEGLLREVGAARGGQLQSRKLLTLAQDTAASWFDAVEPALHSGYNIPDEIANRYNKQFTKLLELSGGRPSKTVVQTILKALLLRFHADLVVAVQTTEPARLKFPSLDAILLHAAVPEKDYLEEAIDCARSGRRRAAVIMAWCAAINRLHLYVQRMGFDRFNEASTNMAAVQSGRYKRFNKRFQIQNLSDLRISVFDSDLLWILEYMGAIDANQHERLETCFTMRNTSAHPGDAPLSDENLLSFFSDIDTMVFANVKFEVVSTHLGTAMPTATSGSSTQPLATSDAAAPRGY